MFESLRKFISKLYYGENQSDTISPSKRRHNEDEDLENSRIKQRRTDAFDPSRRDFSSGKFLTPLKEIHASREMASARRSLYPPIGSHSLTSVSSSTRSQESKENVINLVDDEEEDDEDQPKDSSSKQDMKKWLAAKFFPESESFRALKNATIEKKQDLQDDVEVIEFVESFGSNARRNGCTMISRTPPSRSTTSFYQKAKPNRLKNSPISRPIDRSFVRKTALQESFRLDEKKKYSQLLQNFTSVPKPNTYVKWCSSTPNVSGNLIKDARQRFTPKVEVVDLTGASSMEPKEYVIKVKREWEEMDHFAAVKSSSTSKLSDMKTSETSPLDSKKVNIVDNYDPDWTKEILQKYDLKNQAMKQELEKEKIRGSLKGQKSQELIHGVLSEQLKNLMKISEAAVEEIIDLDEEEEQLRLPALTPAMEKMITAAFRGGHPSEVLVEAFSQRITRRDIHTLSGQNWLNDEVINFYMNLLIERGKQEKYPAVYCFNTFFYPKLAGSGHASLKRWTRKIDVFAHEILIVPIHLGVHWCMSSINLKEKNIRYYDSMGGKNTTCLQYLIQYLKDESMDKKKQPFDTTGWKLINVEGNPQQMNGSDCGMFSCMYAEFICRRARINFSQENMPYFRRKMVYEIINKKLLL